MRFLFLYTGMHTACPFVGSPLLENAGVAWRAFLVLGILARCIVIQQYFSMATLIPEPSGRFINGPAVFLKHCSHPPTD
jgi:hypothetical protein